MEAIIANIRNSRNQLITSVMTDDGIKIFIETHFDSFEISRVKSEFLKRDLKELQNSQLDLVHYAALIRLMKEQNKEIPIENYPLFMEELKTVFKKYGF